MTDLPDDNTNHPTEATDGYFEHEVHFSRGLAVRFLRELADQIDDGTELTISGDGWQIPFEYREPIEVEINFTSQHEKELEIALEFEGSRRKDGITVE